MIKNADVSETGVCCQRLGGKYLAFLLGGQTYGLDIMRIHEIANTQHITPSQLGIPHVVGVMSLRGNCLPVVDLREPGPCPPGGLSQEACIVVAPTGGQQFGLIVEKVLEVHDIARQDISQEPLGRGCVPQRFIQGVANVAGKEIALLDISRILSDENRQALCGIMKALHQGP